MRPTRVDLLYQTVIELGCKGTCLGSDISGIELLNFCYKTDTQVHQFTQTLELPLLLV